MGHLNSFKTSEEGMLAPLSLIQRLLLFLYSLVLFFLLFCKWKQRRRREKMVLLSELEAGVINSLMCLKTVIFKTNTSG